LGLGAAPPPPQPPTPNPQSPIPNPQKISGLIKKLSHNNFH